MGKITLSPDFIFTFYTFSLFSLVRPKYFPHTRLVWLLLTCTFSPDQSGKTPILPPHQTSLVRRWRIIVTRPVWYSPTRLHPMPSYLHTMLNYTGFRESFWKCLETAWKWLQWCYPTIKYILEGGPLINPLLRSIIRSPQWPEPVQSPKPPI